jgi:hypothetical protein
MAWPGHARIKRHEAAGQLGCPPCARALRRCSPRSTRPRGWRSVWRPAAPRARGTRA